MPKALLPTQIGGNIDHFAFANIIPSRTILDASGLYFSWPCYLWLPLTDYTDCRCGSKNSPLWRSCLNLQPLSVWTEKDKRLRTDRINVRVPRWGRQESTKDISRQELIVPLSWTDACHLGSRLKIQDSVPGCLCLLYSFVSLIYKPSHLFYEQD